MGEKKNPRIPSWKTWILIITTVQAISAVQDFRIHQQMWEAIHYFQSVQNQTLQIEMDYHQDLNRVLELIFQKIQGQQ